MRPPAIEKMGFYPTSTLVAELLKTYFQPAESGRLLDPCAGEGTAASILAKALNCQSWGAELSPVARRAGRRKDGPSVQCALGFLPPDRRVHHPALSQPAVQP